MRVLILRNFVGLDPQLKRNPLHIPRLALRRHSEITATMFGSNATVCPKIVPPVRMIPRRRRHILVCPIFCTSLVLSVAIF
jgi:hypothetical protein